jgi:Protein of unknown function (Hypoth_ymh)
MALIALARHYARGNPTGYASDIADMRERDLPAIVNAVQERESQGLDAGLVRCIASSWEAQHYANGVRDAFIYLETVMREVGSIGPDLGVSGAQLASAVLGPKSPGRVTLSSDTALGRLTSGEAGGAYNLVKGAFQLYRNATSHRLTAYSRGEAENVVRLVNLCLQLLPRERPERTPSGQT